MSLSVAHVIVYILILIAAFVAGYYSGNMGLQDAHARPIFAAFHLPLRYMSAPPSGLVSSVYPTPVVAPTPTTQPPVPLVTLAAANELPSTNYAAY